MNVLIDTNVLIDVLADRQPFALDSAVVWKLVETAQIRGFISVLSVPNIVYILRRELSAETVDEIVKKLFLIFEAASLTADDELRASSMRWHDFEDALQSVAAANVGAEYIITRNTADYKDSPVPAVTPAEFIKHIRGQIFD